MYYFSYDSYCDQFSGPEKLQFTSAVLAKVTDTIRDLLLQNGDCGFEDSDLRADILNWERSEDDQNLAFVSIELLNEKDGPKWYSREFTFDESGQVWPVVR